jgi:hypothetical protein
MWNATAPKEHDTLPILRKEKPTDSKKYVEEIQLLQQVHLFVNNFSLYVGKSKCVRIVSQHNAEQVQFST